MKRDLIKDLKEGNVKSIMFLRLIRKAIAEPTINDHLEGEYVVFEQGSGRYVKVHKSIVEEAIGCQYS